MKINKNITIVLFGLWNPENSINLLSYDVRLQKVYETLTFLRRKQISVSKRLISISDCNIQISHPGCRQKGDEQFRLQRNEAG